MMTSLTTKIQSLKERFSDCNDSEARYRRIIELGRELAAIPESARVESNRVEGCQSRMYLFTEWADGKMTFRAESDALISSGLSALLTMVYSGESPEVVLKEAPTYLEELGISNSISPNRANGLYSLHLRMKQEALKTLVTAS